MADESTDSDSFPRKRLKTSELSKVQSPKLKSKLEDEPYHENQPSAAENSAPRNCAICFLEDGKAVRGEIDCCDHYFCFLCIMEWSKTESRCPMCRRRFASIRRPPKDGVFASERLIKISVRDQVTIFLEFFIIPFRFDFEFCSLLLLIPLCMAFNLVSD